jgi:hypothetical protein
MNIDIPIQAIFDYLNALFADVCKGKIRIKSADVEESQVGGTWTFKLTYEFKERPHDNQD